MNRHRNNNQEQSQHLHQQQNRRSSMNSNIATRRYPYLPKMNNIHEDALADGRNFVQGMLAQIKDLYKDVIKLTEERNQLRIENAILEMKKTDLERQVANFRKLEEQHEEQHEKAEEEKRKVAPVQSGLKMLDLGLAGNSLKKGKTKM